MERRNRLYDIVLFGATGYTGRAVAKYICKHGNGLRWAVAGRSHSKLSDVISELLVEVGWNTVGRTTNRPDVLIADANDFRTLTETFSTTCIVLNCTGPYRFLGKNIVEACLASSTHYLDICGEPQFMENCFYKYHDRAVDKNILILHACAFDSVPADLGCIFAMRQFPPALCSSIESFLVLNCPAGLGAHSTTFECAVHGFGDTQTLRNLRRDIDYKYQPPKVLHVGPKIERFTGSYYFEQRMNKYAIPFMGADASVVRSSQRSLSIKTGERHWPQYAAYATIDRFYNVAATGMYGFLFSTLASSSIGRSVLLSSPQLFSNGVFSHTGPTQAQLEQTTFEMHFIATGYSSLEASQATVKILPLGSSDVMRKTAMSKTAATDEEQIEQLEELAEKISSDSTLLDSMYVEAAATKAAEVAAAASGGGRRAALNTVRASSFSAVSVTNTPATILTPSDADTISSLRDMDGVRIRKEVEEDGVGGQSPSPSTRTPKKGKLGRVPISELSDTAVASRSCQLVCGSGILSSPNGTGKRGNKATVPGLDGTIEPVSAPMDRRVKVVVSGPEPGYVATPAILITLAKCILEEPSSLPAGGVFTPGAAFFECTSIFSRLSAAGVEFRVVCVDQLDSGGGILSSRDFTESEVSTVGGLGKTAPEVLAEMTGGEVGEWEGEGGQSGEGGGVWEDSY